MKSHRTKVVAGAAALVAAAGGGVAIAGTGALSPAAESEAILGDVAEQLDIEPSRLSEAFERALANRVDAAVAAGRLTEEQGEALKERIEAGEAPLLGTPFLHGGPGGHLGGLDAAASYLELSEEGLREALEGGRTLAEVARDRDRSVDGLIEAMVASATDRLDGAVDEGRLTEAQRDSVAADLEERITDLVNGEGGPRFGFGRGFSAGPPPMAA
jgi:hypothetical protein